MFSLLGLPARSSVLEPGYGGRAVSDLSRLERERDVLVLAASDMRQVIDAAHTLQHAEMNDNAERVMWTGLVVTYARPFVRTRKVSQLVVSGRLAKPEPEHRDPHAELLARRNDLAAHTDDHGLRGVMDWGEQTSGSRRYSEKWSPYDERFLPEIVALASSQESRFKKRLDEIGEELKLLDG